VRPRRSSDDSAPGQDSFLDVVANLVGILIILVMIIGTSAKEAYIDAVPEAETEQLNSSAAAVQAAEAMSANLVRDVNEIAEKIRRQKFDLDYRTRERDKLLLQLTVAERQLEQEKNKLDSQQQRQLDLHRRIEEIQRDLQASQQALEAVASNTSAPSIIEHLPTPMAKTVFGKELHFRLLNGRLTYLPWDEIVARLKEELPQQLWKLRDTASLAEEAGPVGGFRIRYLLKQVDYPIETKVGPVVQKRAELDHFELVPTSDNLGEPLQQALQANSQFHARLANEDPRQTTITVWVYPDGFDQFRSLKTTLFERGYLTAARPLPTGRLIGGSPSGSRSASQ
jgi:hypothetical protein